MELRITESSRDELEQIDLDRVYELTLNGFMIYPINEDTPCPWDAYVSISEDGNDVLISGGAGPSGYGNCLCTVPKKDFYESYHFFVEPIDDKAKKELITIFQQSSITTLEDKYG